MKRVQLRIIGRVQGVFYRNSTQRHARTLGLTGWVRNECDGSVRAELQGEEHDVHTMVQWCHHGPPHADVVRVDVRDIDTVDTEATFEIR
jgi:acylphosphatase